MARAAVCVLKVAAAEQLSVLQHPAPTAVSEPTDFVLQVRSMLIAALFVIIEAETGLLVLTAAM